MKEGDGCSDKLPENAINLDHTRMLCPMHGEPFRKEWPSGYPHYVVMSFQLVTALDGFWNKNEGETDKDYIERALSAKPTCCRIGPEAMVELLHRINEDTQTWSDGWCRYCNMASRSICWPKTKNQWNRLVDRGPCCLECWYKKFIKGGLN